MKKKSIFGLLLVLSLVLVACGNSLEGQEVIYFGAPATDGPDGQAIQSSFDEFTDCLLYTSPSPRDNR